MVLAASQDQIINITNILAYISVYNLLWSKPLSEFLRSLAGSEE